jgi:sec-independent protein translocase protein TatB
MFDISFTELLVIGFVALVVIGPERLPKVARTLGHLLGRAQRYVNDMKADIQREIKLDELHALKNEIQDTAQGVSNSMRDIQDVMHKPAQVIAPASDDGAVGSASKIAKSNGSAT